MKLTLKVILILALLGGSFSSIAQQGRVIKKGNEEFRDNAFIKARESYLKLVEDGNKSESLLKRLGDSYYYTADYVNAAKWYGVLYQSSVNLDPEYLYRYALALKSNEQYVISDKIMEEFSVAAEDDVRAVLFMKERDYLEEIQIQSGRFEIHSLGINSKLSDFAPSFNGALLTFASNGTDGTNPRKVHTWNNQPFLDLFSVEQANASGGSGVTKFDDEINTKYHESTAVYTKDGTTMYFTRNNFTKGKYKSDNNGTNKLKLYRAVRNGKSWDVEELPFNSNQYSVAHPALSLDEKTLYFASDMPGGLGMSDLYKIAITDETFGTPVNLGDGINTEGRDTFPFVSSDNYMYYASDGHQGLGGLDVYVTEVGNDTFGDVYNVGAPLNSSKDDFSFIIDASGKGFFASNRDGGKGYDDIYGFTQLSPLVLPCNQLVAGQVKDKNTNQIIAGATVKLLDSNNVVLVEDTSDANGRFDLGMIDCETKYTATATKEKYSKAEKTFTSTVELNLAIDQLMYMTPEVATPNAAVGEDLTKILNLNNINFDLDKSFIRRDASIELEKVITYMLQYPTVIIDVRSHTDSRGSDNYNLALSERRAASTIDYIISKGGISSSRISGRGYGETQLLNECANGVKCQDIVHEQNRRSEFIILSK